MSCCVFGHIFWTSNAGLPRLFRYKHEHVSARPQLSPVWTAYRPHGLAKIRRIRSKTAWLPLRNLSRADAWCLTDARSLYGRIVKKSSRHLIPRLPSVPYGRSRTPKIAWRAQIASSTLEPHREQRNLILIPAKSTVVAEQIDFVA